MSRSGQSKSRAHTCACCTGEVRDLAICRRCEARAKGRLKDLPGLTQDLVDALSRQTLMYETNDGGKSAERALVFDQQASKVLASSRNALVGWCRILVDDHGADWPKNDTISAMARMLLDCWPMLRRLSTVGELVADLDRIVPDILRTIDLPKSRTYKNLGPCPETLEDAPCPGQVDATVFTDDDAPERDYMRCGYCKTRWTPDQWDRAGRRILGRMNQVRMSEIRAREFLRRVAAGPAA